MRYSELNAMAQQDPAGHRTRHAHTVTRSGRPRLLARLFARTPTTPAEVPTPAPQSAVRPAPALRVIAGGACSDPPAP